MFNSENKVSRKVSPSNKTKENVVFTSTSLPGLPKKGTKNSSVKETNNIQLPNPSAAKKIKDGLY